MSTDKKPNQQNEKNTKMTSKQIVAILGIVILVLLYIISLITAIFDKSASGRMFMTSMIATIFIPFLIWIYTWMFGKLTGRRTFADITLDREDASADASDSADASEADEQ